MDYVARSSFPYSLYSAAQVRQLDRLAIQQQHIAGLVLMKRAGHAVFELLCEYWPDAPITVFCGSGNNAGDGYVVAALAARENKAVKIVQVGELEKLQGDAKLAYQEAKAAKVKFVAFTDALTVGRGVIVDALLGTGLVGAVRESVAQSIRCINRADLPVVAVDIPSGLCSDTGRELGVAVKSDAVMSFIGLKRGLFTGRGPELVGEVFFDDLAVPAEIYDALASDIALCCLATHRQALTPRRRDAHKGDCGHVLVVGGDHGMAGAVVMAAEAALRVGAGLVSVATRAEHVSGLLARRPELMVHAVVSGQELEPLLRRATVIVIGPGLGCSPWSEQLLQQVLRTDVPLLLDADALNIIAQRKLSLAGHRDCVITPHPGEAARLLGCQNADVQDNRYAAVRQLRQKFQAVSVLKGAGTLIAAEGGIQVSSLGNPGMASGGMGDLLSGIIAGLIAQGLGAEASAVLGVNLHGAAADVVAEQSGERGMLATDLLLELQPLVNS